MSPVRWISVVSAGYPPEYALVLVWIAETAESPANYDLAYRFNGEWYFGDPDDDFGAVVEDPWVITHWWSHPLPAPPEDPGQTDPLN